MLKFSKFYSEKKATFKGTMHLRTKHSAHVHMHTYNNTVYSAGRWLEVNTPNIYIRLEYSCKQSRVECILMVDIHRVFKLPHDLLTRGRMKEGEQGKRELCENGR